MTDMHDDYATAATAREAKRLALQGVVEIDRGLAIALQELRAGRFMAARQTLETTRALTPVLEGAIQGIRSKGAAR